MMNVSATYASSNQSQNAAERRTHQRHSVIAPAEVLDDASQPAKALMVDLSRGGCFVETDRPLALGTLTQVAVVKGSESFQAQAKVVFAAPNKGMGLEFTAVGPKEFKAIGTLLDKSLQNSWHAANRQRGQRIQLRVPVRVSGYNDQGARFNEESHTLEINALGGSVLLSSQVKEGQRIVVSHAQTKAAIECLVVSTKQVDGNRSVVGIAFLIP